MGVEPPRLRHRSFRLFYARQAISLTGDAAFSVALAWQVVASDGDAQFLGLVLAAAPGLAVVLLASGLRGAAFTGMGIVWGTSLQQRVDPAMRGRVASLDMRGSFALLPAATLITGVAATRRGARHVRRGRAVILLCGLVGLVLPKARRFEVEKKEDTEAEIAPASRGEAQ